MKLRLTRILWIGLGIAVALGSSATATFANESSQPAKGFVQGDTVDVPGFELPLSSYLGSESRAALKELDSKYRGSLAACPSDEVSEADDSPEHVRCLIRFWLDDYYLPKQKARFRTVSNTETIGGVPVQIIKPFDGIAASRRHQVIICVGHGIVDAIPIAATARIEVVTLDGLREGREVTRETIASVFKALLRDYKAASIGLYGVPLEELVWFQTHGLPTPGAVAMPDVPITGGGDSENLFAAVNGGLKHPPNTDAGNPRFPPGLPSPAMSRFPATLLITSTRDEFMSPIIVAHTELSKLGVRAELHIWEGVGHAFYLQPDLPESREVYDVVVRFFANHLHKGAH